MTDYSFMKTGHSNVKSPEKISEKNKEEIEEILCLFTNNALLNAVKYVELCKRNGITKQDIEKMQQIKDPNYRVYQPLYKELSAKGIQCFDFAEEFHDLDTAILFENKGHYSPHGNEIIANKLFDIIDQIR